MKAFLNDEAVKQKYLNRVREHARLDEIHKGQYVDEAKRRFSAVGCTIHSSEFNQYEIELGIPEWLARLEDKLFQGLPTEALKEWPERFLSAIKVGSDLDKIKTPFLIFILEKNLTYLDSLPDMSSFKDIDNAIKGSRAAVEEMLRCHREGLDLLAAGSQAEIAANSAQFAARSAESMANLPIRLAADSATSAAESAAESGGPMAWTAAQPGNFAAYLVAWSSEKSARSLRSAVDSAAASAEWSAAAWSATQAACSAAYEKYADKLIELIEICE